MWTDIGQQGGIELAVDGGRDGSEAIHRLKPPLQAVDGIALSDVGLGDDEPVGHRGLLRGLGHRVELSDAVDRVDQRHDAVQPVLRAEKPVGLQRMQHRNRIGEPARLDEDAIKVDHFAGAALDEELTQRFLKVGAQCAAQAAVGQQRHLLGRRGDQLVIDGDVSEFVDDHRRAAHVGVAEEPAEQGRLAAAQKSGDDGDREPACQRIDCG